MFGGRRWKMASGWVQAALDIAAVWMYLVPYALATIAILGWGRAVLSAAQVARSAAWSLAGGVTVVLPVMWACGSYFARFRVTEGEAVRAGGLMALKLLPVWVVMAAVVVFDLQFRRAVKSGYARRSVPVRTLSHLAVAFQLAVGLIFFVVAMQGLAGFRWE